MSAHDDPQYIEDATRVCIANGWFDPRMPYAVNAHWRCESGAGDAYPPTRNNPGNITRGTANDVHATFTVPDPATNPQPGNPIVTFADPHYGADVYGAVLRTLPRYAGVRAAGVAGDPHGFFLAISLSGYHGTSDTNTKCMDDSYIDPVVGAPASIGAPPPGANGWVDASIARLFHPDAKGILRPTTYHYVFEAWVGLETKRKWSAASHGGTNFVTTTFRPVLGPVHKGYFIRLSDAGSTFHDRA